MAFSITPFLKDVQNCINDPIKQYVPLSGTNFTQSFKIGTSQKNYFLKCSREKTQFFFKEANGLEEMRKTKTVDVAHVICATGHFLLLDFIESTPREESFFEDLAASLSNMHRHTASHFGFFENNFLGATLQLNLHPENRSWASFFWEKRLLYQCQLAVDNGFIDRSLENTILSLKSSLFDLLGPCQTPSLLHGDLWSGNIMTNGQGRPCLIDPAVYYGDREAEFAMAHLFGGLPPEFYRAYNEYFPLEKQAKERSMFYQLYHLLNHLNLFGTSYLSSLRKAVLNLQRIR